NFTATTDFFTGFGTLFPYSTLFLSLSRLREGAFGHYGAVLVGPDERRQLALVLSTERLAEVRPDHEGQHGMPLRKLLADLDLVEVPSEGDEHRDIDTWTDLKSL
ncbi:hypothetical protein ABT284_13035, partial [Nocardioides sp. NPDC000441]